MHVSRTYPILFNADMVRAILSGEKTQTRRVVKPQPEMEMDGEACSDGSGGYSWTPVWPRGHRWAGKTLGSSGCPLGQPGQRLWVRETWNAFHVVDCDGYTEVADPLGTIPKERPCDCRAHISYAAGGHEDGPWRPAIHMPRWASRITLEITGVRVQRLQEISEEDARAEGVAELDGHFDNATICAMAKRLGCPAEDARATFALLWDSINAERGAGWVVNPWIWAITFKRVEG